MEITNPSLYELVIFEDFAKQPHSSFIHLLLPPFPQGTGVFRYMSSGEEEQLRLSHAFVREISKLNYNSNTQFIKVKHIYVYYTSVSFSKMSKTDTSPFLIWPPRYLFSQSAAAQLNFSQIPEQVKPFLRLGPYDASLEILFLPLFLCKTNLLFKLHFKPFIFKIPNSSSISENSRIPKTV